MEALCSFVFKSVHLSCHKNMPKCLPKQYCKGTSVGFIASSFFFVLNWMIQYPLFQVCQCIYMIFCLSACMSVCLFVCLSAISNNFYNSWSVQDSVHMWYWSIYVCLFFGSSTFRWLSHGRLSVTSFLYLFAQKEQKNISYIIISIH